jgi:hypothetical protein
MWAGKATKRLAPRTAGMSGSVSDRNSIGSRILLFTPVIYGSGPNSYREVIPKGWDASGET